MTTLDARGISCPEPLLMLKNALKTQAQLAMLVDSKAALDNCEGYAKKQGFTVDIEKEGDTFNMLIAAKNE